MKFLKLTKLKRLIVLVATLVAATLAIVLGSMFYVSKNAKKSIEYGGGAEYLVKIDVKADAGNIKPAQIAQDVADSIQERINPLNVNGANASAEVSGDNANVRIVYPGTFSTDEKKDLERLIVEQPQLVLTDIYGNPLFNEDGRFNSKLQAGDPKGFVGVGTTTSFEDFYKYEETDGQVKALSTHVPIIANGAKAVLHSDGSRVVQITLEAGKETEWTNATTYISSLPENERSVQAWLDPQTFVNKMRNWYHDSWTKVWQDVNSDSHPLYNLAHYAPDLTLAQRTRLITEVANAENYLISSAMVSQPLSGRDFIIQGNFDADSSQRLARRINYGISNYQLKTINSKTVGAEYGSKAFNKAIIAGIVVFSVIALILMVNYGLLGALSTISIALFIFMTLLMFTVMRGEYSPAAIAALIIGIGMSVDANIITFERLKTEMYSGATLGKAFAVSNKKSFSTIFDSNITTMIVAIVLFYFGTRSIVGLSVTLILSIIFTLVIMLLFTRITSTLLVKSGAFDNKKWLVGLKPNFDPKVQEKINKFDYIKNSKWFVLSSGLIMLGGIIIFVIFAAINKSAGGGFVLSQDFAGGSTITLKPAFGAFTDTDIQTINKQLVEVQGIPAGDISHSTEWVTVNTRVNIDNIEAFRKTFVESGAGHLVDSSTIQVSNTTTDVAKGLVKDAMYAVLIAMAAIIVYTLIRFKWTYSIAAIVALVHDAAIVLAIFIIARIEISPIFVAAILSVVGYSINDTIVTFDRIREKAANHIGVMDKAAIKTLANDAIKDTLKRSLWTSLTTVIAVIILMSFGNATKFEFNVAMLVGLISGTYSSIFIATYLWTKLEAFRQKRIQARVKNNFWQTKGTSEQTVQGINDYQV